MRTPSIMRRGAAAIAVLVAAVGLGACGSTEGNLANGKKLYNEPASQCSNCHYLADSGQPGRPTIGPNLDDAFRGARSQGFEKASFEETTLKWIEQPEQRSLPIMPAGLLKGQDARDVAAYIAEVAGRDAESPSRPIEPVKDTLAPKGPPTEAPAAGEPEKSEP